MPPAAIVTLIASAILVLALAAYLTVIAFYLRRTVDTLGKVVFGVRAIAHRVGPIEGLVTLIERDLVAVDDALGDLLREGANS